MSPVSTTAQQPLKVYRARNIAPVGTPPVEDGAIAVRKGRIIAVGRWPVIQRKVQAQQVSDLGEVLVTPGLVNAHVHLELSDLVRPAFTGKFTDWLAGIRQQQLARGTTPEAQSASISAAVEAGVDQCRRFGVVAVGDISQHAAISRAVLTNSTLWGMSFAEVLGLGAFRHRFHTLLDNALRQPGPFGRVRAGISPHSPYTLDPRDFQTTLQAAHSRGMPVASHIAEHPAEQAFLQHHTGEFRDLWDKLGTWDDAVASFQGSPMELARTSGLISSGGLLAHVNYASQRDLKILSGSPATVAFCPRTHAYFGHKTHPLMQMMQLGVRVVLATDSCASSGDLDLLAEARLVRQLFPDLSASHILRMITLTPARALAVDQHLGTLAAGKAAVWCVFDSAQRPEDLLQTSTRPQLMQADASPNSPQSAR
jgi:cytosine/adenosine deaminase-related metal-dependent hydrolase